MVYIHVGRYNSRHPKDRMANRYTDLKGFIRDRQISKNEQHNPSETNIDKCYKESKITNKATKELKRIGRVLGLPTNCETFRRGS